MHGTINIKFETNISPQREQGLDPKKEKNFNEIKSITVKVSNL